MTTQDQSLFESTLNIIQKLRNISKPEIVTDCDLKRSDLNAISERTLTYTNYLKSFVSDYQIKSRHQRIMKTWFFAIIMSLLCVIIIASFVALIIISGKKDVQPEDVATLITAVVGALSAFMFLPKVIASNLFPSKEEDKTAEIFSNMFQYDITLRGLYHVNDDLNEEKNNSKNQDSIIGDFENK